MCDGAIDLDEAGRIFGSDAQWWRTEIPALDSLQHDGLLMRTDARIILTPEGVTLARIVASTFDTYLTRGQARHSIVL